MTTIVNLTPHALNIVLAGPGEPTIAVAPSGSVARCATRSESLEPLVAFPSLATVPVARVAFGAVEGLPAPVAGTVYIVSALVRTAVGAARPDVLSPGELVRDAAGQPVGCRGLVAS